MNFNMSGWMWAIIWVLLIVIVLMLVGVATSGIR